MAFADLGVRILLEDGASAGFNALSLSMFNIFTRTGLLHSVWSSLSPAMKAVGIGAATAGLLFGGLSDFLKQCVDAAAQLEQEIANMSVSVNGATEAGNALTDTLINIADHSIYTTALIADGFTTLGVDGWTAKDLIDGMGQAMANFAEASRTDVVPAANLLGTTMETYGAVASDATQYTDDLTFALYNGQKTVANLQAAFNQAGSTAANLKIPFGDLMDVLALLGEDGLKGTMAGSALRYMLTSLVDPTTKASKELAALGIVVINNNVPAFKQLYSQLLASGGAAAKSAEQYDGTVTSLQKMFTEAQKAGVIHTDLSFYQWATAAGILSDKLFDANGNFIGINGTIQLLGQTLDKLNPEQKSQALQQLFNVRGAQAAKLLLDNYKTTLDKYGNLDAIRKGTDTTKKAADVTNTLSGQLQRLGSTWKDTMARLGSVDLGPFKNLASSIADVLHNFNSAPKPVRDFVGQLLLLVTAAAGLTFVIGIVVFIVGAFGGVIAGIAGPVAAVLGIIAGLVAVFLVLKNAIEHNKQIADIFHTVMGLLGGLLHNLGEQFQALWKTLQQLTPVWNILKIVVLAVALVIGGIIVVTIGILIGILIAVTFVITKVINFFQMLFGAIGNFLGMLGSNMHRVPDMLMKPFRVVGEFIQLTWNKIKAQTMAFIVTIQANIQKGFNTVKQKIQQAINFVVGLFSWLYNHNYYFQHLVDFIKQKIADIQKVFTNIRTWLTTTWTNLWNGITNKLHEVWTNITNRFNQGKTDVQSKFNEIKGIATGLWNALWATVTNKVHEAWNNVTGAFNNAKGMVTSKIDEIKNNIINPIKNLGQQLFDSAKRAIQMFIDGMGSMIGKVKDKAGEIAGGITKVLGFHSPPKEGPLADSDSYMPNMMRMFGSGIEQHAGVVVGSATRAATHIGSALSNINPSVGNGSIGTMMTRSMVSSIQASQAQGGINQTLTIPVQIDGQTVSGIVLQQVGKQLTVNGIGRALR